MKYRRALNATSPTVIDSFQRRDDACRVKKKEAKKEKRCSPVEGLLVLLDFAARQLVELRVNVHELVLLLHLLALLEFVVDPLPPAEQAAEFGVRWHDPRAARSELCRVKKGEEFALKARAQIYGDARDTRLLRVKEGERELTVRGGRNEEYSSAKS